jgi:tetratricopeptide (TPR) repeat protein
MDLFPKKTKTFPLSIITQRIGYCNSGAFKTEILILEEPNCKYRHVFPGKRVSLFHDENQRADTTFLDLTSKAHHNVRMSVIIIPSIVALVFILLIVVFSLSKDKKDQPGNKKNYRKRDREAQLRDANRRLAQNPRDAEALQIVAEDHMEKGAYDKAMRTYDILIELCASDKELDEFDFTLKHALAAMKAERYKEAYKSFMLARTMKDEVFEINYNLGYLEYRAKNFEKAQTRLQQAVEQQPEHVKTLRYLGLTRMKLKKYSDAANSLRKAIDLEPDDKETMFALGQCYQNMGKTDQALQIFSHLRSDPQIGPTASLYAGSINAKNKRTDQAILDFTIGLRHEKIKLETKLELMYRLALSYIAKQQLGDAIALLEDIQNSRPAYRDVPALIQQYSELNRNQNLQTFLISPTSDFVALCRKLVYTFFEKAKIKIVDISMYKNEYADILTEVSTAKWEDTVLFRFVRTTNQVGELLLRDLYAKVKEVKAGRGVCASAGNFSEGAQSFVEARLIDLVEKEQLLNRMKQTRSMDSPGP